MAQTLTLTTPVEGPDGPIAVLELRAPVGRDIRECGVPYVIGDSGAVQMEAEAVAKLLARLAAVPSVVIDRLSAADWNAGMGLLMGFFGAATRPTS